MGILAIQGLTDFLTAIAGQPDGPGTRRTAVEYTARALSCPIAVLAVDGAPAATVGLPAGPAPAELLRARPGGSVLAVPQVGTCAVAAAPVGEQPAGRLVIARPGVTPFDAEDLDLLGALAKVLELSLQAQRVLAADRRRAAANGRLVDSLRGRQRLLEQLFEIHRAIARQAPWQEVLDTITTAARELLGVDSAALTLLEADDRTVLTIRSSCGLPPEAVDRMRRIPVTAGVTGLAVRQDGLVERTNDGTGPVDVPELVGTGLNAVLAVPLHDNGAAIGCLLVGSHRPGHDWDKIDHDILQSFADQVSLALTEASTLEAMHQPTDPLTGLAGRASFMSTLEHAFTVPEVPGVAALFVDLDRFKVVNDSLGHAAGDLLLQGVAERIRAALRPGDTAARLGGDEFGVLLPDTAGADDAVPVARRILTSLAEPFDLAGKETFISSSVGIAYSPAGDADPHDLMVRADLAMDQAKKHGKDRYEIFEPDMQSVFQSGLKLEADLRRAVARHEFVLRYQPIVRLRTGEITGLEALIRWQHPSRGLVPPLDFIPVAEETGMIVPIGAWVLREACRQVAQWNAQRAADRQLTVSVNLSAVQLDQAALPALVADALASSGLPAGCLVLELTESLLVDHRASTLQRLRELKELGVRLAIDDFGTGYSSLAYLRRFPVDIIKIDKSFVDEVGDVPAASALTMGIIQLGQALQLSTIAEGIEDQQQLTELTEGNCELGQGFFFAEPLDGEGLSELLFPPA